MNPGPKDCMMFTALHSETGEYRRQGLVRVRSVFDNCLLEQGEKS